MSSILNRVRQTIVSPAGTGGPLVLNTSAFSAAHTTINSAGGVDAAEYCYVIEENSDFEIQRGSWTSSGNTLARNTPIMSSISGVVGTSLMSLAGNASIRIIIEASELGGLRGLRAITGATDTLLNRDLGFGVIYNRATAIAVALAAPSTNSFRNGWMAHIKNINAGLVTITPTGSTITSDNATTSSLVLAQYDSALIISDGANYFAIVTRHLGSSAIVLTSAQRAQARTNISASIRGARFGCILSTAGSSTTFNVTSGDWADSLGIDMITLGSAISKSFSSLWSVGNAGGALDTGSTAANTWYYVYLIKRPDTGVVDVCVSLSAAAPTTGGSIPAAYTEFRRIGAMKTDVSSNWWAFNQVGEEIHWAANFAELNGSAPGSSAAVAVTLGGVPPGVIVHALLHLTLATNATAGAGILVTSLDENDVLPFSATNNVTLFSVANSFVAIDIVKRTNTSGQIRYRVNQVTGAPLVSMFTYGYIDTCGRLQ